jgi:hypothetical protein
VGIVAGITINSFNSLSLRPPMVLWSLGADRVRAGTFQSCKTYAINVLADDQEPLSRRFAQRSQDDPFAGVSYTSGLGGAPLLKGFAPSTRRPYPVRRNSGAAAMCGGGAAYFSRRPLPPAGRRLTSRLPPVFHCADGEILQLARNRIDAALVIR